MDDALRGALAGEVIFARVAPEHKLRVVAALQAGAPKLAAGKSSPSPGTGSTTPRRSSRPTSAWPWAAAGRTPPAS